MRNYQVAICMVASLTTGVLGANASAVEIVDDFSQGGWRASNPKAPAQVEAVRWRLVITDLPGGDVTWGTSAAKRFEDVSVLATPFLVVDVVEVSGGFGMKLSGGKSWPKKSVCSTAKPGLVVIDIRKATGWEADEGDLNVMLYAQGDGTQIQIGSLRLTDTLSDAEQRVLDTTPVMTTPETVPYAGLLRQAARQGDKPPVVDPAAGERTVYTDPVTGREVWRMTDDPAVERHVYYDILAWNADGSTLMWNARRPGSRYWLMDANGTNIRPLPPPDDGGTCRAPHWSPNLPHVMYFARADEECTSVFALDVRNGRVQQMASVPFPGTIGKRRFSEFPPPHPDERHFLLRWGGQDQHATMLVVVDTETGQHWQFEPSMPTHRVRFTKHANLSIFINSNTDPENPEIEETRTEWILTLDGQLRRFPPGGGHPDWSPDGSWLGVFRDNGIWLVSHDGQTSRELVNISAGGHGGFSITTGDFHVADSPARGPYGNLVYVTELATGAVTPIAYHGSSYSGWQSGVPDPEATHPAPICSPDETKIIYDSDVIGQPDIWVAVWKRPGTPIQVQFQDGRLTWLPPQLHREIAGYNIYRKTDGRWRAYKDLIAETQIHGLPAGEYAVAAQEWSGLESKYAVANTGEVAGDTTPPSAPSSPQILETGARYLVLKWNASLDRDIDHYNVYATSSPNAGRSRADLVGSPKTAAFVDWGCQPGSTLYYQVTAVDRQGNESQASESIQAVFESE